MHINNTSSPFSFLFSGWHKFWTRPIAKGNQNVQVRMVNTHFAAERRRIKLWCHPGPNPPSDHTNEAYDTHQTMSNPSPKRLVKASSKTISLSLSTTTPSRVSFFGFSRYISTWPSLIGRDHPDSTWKSYFSLSKRWWTREGPFFPVMVSASCWLADSIQ